MLLLDASLSYFRNGLVFPAVYAETMVAECAEAMGQRQVLGPASDGGLNKLIHGVSLYGTLKPVEYAHRCSMRRQKWFS